MATRMGWITGRWNIFRKPTPTNVSLYRLLRGELAGLFNYPHAGGFLDAGKRFGRWRRDPQEETVGGLRTTQA